MILALLILMQLQSSTGGECTVSCAHMEVFTKKELESLGKPHFNAIVIEIGKERYYSDTLVLKDGRYTATWTLPFPCGTKFKATLRTASRGTTTRAITVQRKR